MQKQSKDKNTDLLDLDSGVNLIKDAQGNISARYGKMELSASFEHLKKRIAPDVLQKELLVRAAKLKSASAPCRGALDGSVSKGNAFEESASKENMIKEGCSPQKCPAEKRPAKMPFIQKRPLAIDATAGLGEDSFLLAAAGFEVMLIEHNPDIFALLENAIQKAQSDEDLNAIVGHMHPILADAVSVLEDLASSLSTSGLSSSRLSASDLECGGAHKDLNHKDAKHKDEHEAYPSIIYLDPMFAAKTKTSAAKKKFQILHQLEQPCSSKAQHELFSSAAKLKPKKLIVKRHLKGAPITDDIKPSYSLKGKAIRYDCYVNF